MPTWLGGYFEGSASSEHHGSQIISGLSAPATLFYAYAQITWSLESGNIAAGAGNSAAKNGFAFGIGTVLAGGAEPDVFTNVDSNDWIIWGGASNGNTPIFWGSITNDATNYPINSREFVWRGARGYTASRDWWLEFNSTGTDAAASLFTAVWRMGFW